MPKRMFLPNSDRVLVEPVAEEKKGLIEIPEMYQAARAGEPRLARVIAVGPGKIVDPVNGELVPPLFSEGDLVLVDVIGGMNIELDGQKYILLRNEEILGTIEEVEEKPTLTSV